jgi:hypothetical protein
MVILEKHSSISMQHTVGARRTVGSKIDEKRPRWIGDGDIFDPGNRLVPENRCEVPPSVPTGVKRVVWALGIKERAVLVIGALEPSVESPRHFGWILTPAIHTPRRRSDPLMTCESRYHWREKEGPRSMGHSLTFQIAPSCNPFASVALEQTCAGTPCSGDRCGQLPQNRRALPGGWMPRFVCSGSIVHLEVRPEMGHKLACDCIKLPEGLGSNRSQQHGCLKTAKGQGLFWPD